MKTHIDVSLNKSSSSCFFNLIATYTDKPINENELNAQLNSGSMQTLMQLLPTNLYIYQCVNCRLFFTQSSTFSLQVIIVIFIIVFVSITTSDSDNINNKEKMFTFVAFLAWLHYVKSW